MTQQSNLEDICFWHKIAEEEKELTDMPEVTRSYKKIGCYSCDGYNKKCKFYKYITPETNYRGL